VSFGVREDHYFLGGRGGPRIIQGVKDYYGEKGSHWWKEYLWRGSGSYGAKIIVDGTRITVAGKDHCGGEGSHWERVSPLGTDHCGGGEGYHWGKVSPLEDGSLWQRMISNGGKVHWGGGGGG
jgi:hypothetical protein